MPKCRKNFNHPLTLISNGDDTNISGNNQLAHCGHSTRSESDANGQQPQCKWLRFALGPQIGGRDRGGHLTR